MIVYGKNVAKELLKKPYLIKNVYLQEGFIDKNIISGLEKNKIRTKILTKKEIDNFGFRLHQGIILDIKDYQYQNLADVLEDGSQLLVILDHLEDPHNFGAIIRTCEAAGVDAIIVPKDRQVLVNATVMKTSAGALTNMRIIRVSNLVNTIEKLKKDGFWIIGSDMKGTDYKNINYHGKIALVVGNEGSGMSQLVANSCDFIATIPMVGEVNSLNASVSAGILIYEAVQNRK